MRISSIKRAEASVFALALLSLSIAILSASLPVLARPAYARTDGDYPWPAFPLDSDGEINFAVDGVILLNPEGKEQVFFYISLREEDIVCKARDDSSDDAGDREDDDASDGYDYAEDQDDNDAEDGVMQVEASLAFLTRQDQRIVERGTRLDIPCHITGVNIEEPKRFVYLNSVLDPGTSGFEVRVVDRNARRIGLIYALKSLKKRGFARGWLQRVQHSEAGSLSGMLMLWNITDKTELTPVNSYHLGRIEEVREKMEANPLGAYGLFRENASFYCELYDLKDQKIEINLRVISEADSVVLMDSTRELTVPFDRCALVKDLSVAQLPAGSYHLELTVSSLTSAGISLRSASCFQVQWKRDSWRRTQRERVDEASIVLDDVQWESFRFMEAGRQEAFMAEFWRQHEADSAPPGYLQAKYHQRIVLADERFGGIRRGALTDRGKVFVRFGEPDEIHKELNPQEADWIFNYLKREIDETEASEMGGRPMMHRLDQSSYVVWHYLNRGDPLLTQWGDATGGRSLRFIFIDELAGQDYRLIYSSLFGGF